MSLNALEKERERILNNYKLIGKQPLFFDEQLIEIEKRIRAKERYYGNENQDKCSK